MKRSVVFGLLGSQAGQKNFLELSVRACFHVFLQFPKKSDDIFGKRRKLRASSGTTADTLYQQRLAESFFRGANAFPYAAVTHSEFFCRGQYRSGSFNGFKYFQSPASENHFAGLVDNPSFRTD